jgi:hypothetical protein
MKHLAGEAGIDYLTLHKAETGVRVTWATQRRIADALGVEIAQVAEFVTEPGCRAFLKKCMAEVASLWHLSCDACYNHSS